MPEYLFTARKRNGETFTNRVTAESVEAARDALAESGLTDILFHTDDGNAFLDAAIKREMDPTGQGDVVPAERALATRRRGGFLTIFRDTWQANASFVVPLACSGLVGILLSWFKGSSGLGGTIRLSLVAMIVFTAAWPGVAYQALLRAVVWNRLWETRLWAGFLRHMRFPGGGRVPSIELDVRLACVLARHGQTEAGRKLMMPYLTKAQQDGDLFVLCRLPTFFDAAGDHTTSLDLRRQATALSAGSTMMIIDEALCLARYLRRPAEARVCLSRIADRELTETARMFVSYIEGLIALDEMRFTEAVKAFDRLDEIVQPMARAELMRGMVREFWAYHALALAGTGRFAEARALLARARPLLEARRSTSLLERCDAAIPQQPGR